MMKRSQSEPASLSFVSLESADKKSRVVRPSSHPEHPSLRVLSATLILSKPAFLDTKSRLISAKMSKTSGQHSTQIRLKIE